MAQTQTEPQIQTQTQPQTQTQTGTLAGYFEDTAQARRAVEALRDAGFTSAHVGMAHRESTTTSQTTGSQTTGSQLAKKASGTWENIKGFFHGNDTEQNSDGRPQGDSINRQATANSGDGYAQYGNEYDPSDLQHSLKGLSIPEDSARYFGDRFSSNRNGAVVTVNAEDRASEAESILTRFGADLGKNSATYDYATKSAAAQDSNRQEGTQDAQTIQLLGEVLRVHKDRVSRGEVHIRKEVITENQTIQVPVTREELVIERHAADPNTPSQGSVGKGEEIRIPLSEERASVDKNTVVREEVSVGKKQVENVRNLSDDVRHEELIVDDSTKRSA